MLHVTWIRDDHSTPSATAWRVCASRLQVSFLPHPLLRFFLAGEARSAPKSTIAVWAVVFFSLLEIAFLIPAAYLPAEMLFSALSFWQ